MVLDVEVEVGFGRIAGVATATDSLSALYAVALGNLDAPALKVCQHAVLTVRVFDGDVVTEDVTLAQVEPSTGARSVTMAVVCCDDDAVRGCEYRFAVAVVLLRARPVANVSVALFVRYDEVVGVSLGEDTPRVGVLAGGTSVDDCPRSDVHCCHTISISGPVPDRAITERQPVGTRLLEPVGVRQPAAVSK